MISVERFRELANELSETGIIDFKSNIYQLDHRDERIKEDYKAGFIKDVISMANTPRSGAAFIVMGIENHADRGTPKNIKKGVSRTLDDNTHQLTLKRYVYPVPQVSTQIIQDEGKTFVVLEIGDYRPSDGPFMSLLENGSKLKKKTIYYRNGSSNTEASREPERQRIYEWFHDGARDNREAWPRFLEGVHNFEVGRQYVLLTSAINTSSVEQREVLANAPLVAVFDFDRFTDSDKEGLYHAVRPKMENIRSLHLFQPNARPRFHLGKTTYWLTVAGLSMPEEKQVALNRRMWLREFKRGIDWQIGELGKAINPLPVTCLVLCYDYDFDTKLFELILDQVGSVFGEAIDFLFVSDPGINLTELAEEYHSVSLNMPFRALSDGLFDRLCTNVATNAEEFTLPGSHGNPIRLSPKQIPWLEEHFEFVYLNRGLLEDSSDVTSREFLRGAEITWAELDGHFDAQRDKAPNIIKRIRTLLEQRSTSRVQIYYPAGGGGTTVAHRVLWDIHTEFPSLILKTAQGIETITRLEYVVKQAEIGVLVLVDSPSIVRSQMDDLRDLAQSIGLPVVFLVVERQLGKGVQSEVPNRFTIEGQLSDREIARFHAAFYPYARDHEAQQRLDTLRTLPRGTEHTAFNFGFTAFGEDYQRIGGYVSFRLERLTEVQKEMVGFLALAHHFGRSRLNAQSFAGLLGIPPTKVVNLNRAFANSLETLDLLVEDSANEWRTSHEILEQEILRQLLWPGLGNRENWRQNLSKWLIRFIAFCRGNGPSYSRDLRDVVSAVLVNRGNDVELGTERAGNNTFAPVIEAIPSREGFTDSCQ